MYPGEYVQPLVRQTLVQCPVVSGYVTARLQAQDQIPPNISGQSERLGVVFHNVGNTQFSVVLRETDDRSISGTRYTLTGFTGTAITVVPGGYYSGIYSGQRQFMEVFCTGTTDGQLRMQIESQRRWTEMGFDRSDPFYPPSLFRAKEYPGPTT